MQVILKIVMDVERICKNVNIIIFIINNTYD